MSKDFHNCPICVANGHTGSCARLRCYCGHKECWAYDSWVDVRRGNGEHT